mmetsp:Transcript_51430/g.112753  ORF Transcript_51430/g.112753 Transcript_51430/m.112753 type:complete len:162 (+) Transcript_51430:875-1360(+)
MNLRLEARSRKALMGVIDKSGVVGRGSDAEHQVSDLSTVSRRHAKLLYSGAGLLHITNLAQVTIYVLRQGTLMRLQKDQCAALRAGDLLVFLAEFTKFQVEDVLQGKHIVFAVSEVAGVALPVRHRPAASKLRKRLRGAEKDARPLWTGAAYPAPLRVFRL